jgi:hypothetical protein
MNFIALNVFRQNLIGNLKHNNEKEKTDNINDVIRFFRGILFS